MHSLLERFKHLPHGAHAIMSWLGAGGIAVDNQTAQARANVCLKCDKRIKDEPITGTVADGIRKILELKNKAGLRVMGEKQLGTCGVCRCVLRLKVFEPQAQVEKEITNEERPKFPAYCWQINP